MKKKIGLGFLIIIAFLQFFRIDKTNPEVIVTDDFIEISNPPEEVAIMIKSSCYDCHSNKSSYPWYSNIAPVSWWVKHHIDEAREELNFSKWGTYSEKKKAHKLEEMVDEVDEGEMPLKPYPLTHSEAQLTSEQREQLISWFNQIRQEAKESKEEKTLQLNNGEKWITNPETTMGIENMLKMTTNKNRSANLETYSEIGKNLSLEMKSIFAQCTMKGEGHNQLHLYLIPLVKQFRGLEEAEDIETAMRQNEKTVTYLNTYNTYFISE